MQEVDGEGVSVETRVEGAMEEVQDRLKQLQKTPRGQVRLTLTCLVNGSIRSYFPLSFYFSC